AFWRMTMTKAAFCRVLFSGALSMEMGGPSWPGERRPMVTATPVSGARGSDLQNLRRPFRFLLLAMVGLLTGALLYYFLITYYGATPDIKQVGGTILVYEIDQDTGQSNKDAQSALIDAIRIRLNHAGHRKLTVRPDDKGRVEIAIPRSD